MVSEIRRPFGFSYLEFIWFFLLCIFCISSLDLGILASWFLLSCMLVLINYSIANATK